MRGIPISSNVIIEKSIRCPGDGFIIPLPNSPGIIVCPACKHEYNYRPEIFYNSYLILNIRKKPHSYRISGDITIGRDTHDYVVVKDYLRNDIFNKFPLQCSYVSGLHCSIKAEPQLVIKKMEDGDYIVNHLLCKISDKTSRNKTSVNEELLRVDSIRTLKHGDAITLAPHCKRKIKFEFIERREVLM